MSTFRGIVEEIPGISLDRFDDENLSSSAYFLTHLHSDHTKGLDQTFFQQLKHNERYLYCTRLTKLFLEGKYRLAEELSCYVKELKPCSPTIIDYIYKDRHHCVTVNCVPAGHCPGSIMFIFEIDEKTRVLCTGDFRISPADLSKLKPLNIVQEGTKICPQKFAKIYLDTTFLNPAYPEFPTRQQSLVEICRLTQDWLSRDCKNIVSIECPAIYGSEFLWIEIMEKLKKPVHVKPRVYDDYTRISELSRSITNDPKATSIHACREKFYSRETLPCRHDVDDENIMTIAISAMRWRDRDLKAGISEKDANKRNRFYVCCSMHPSYNELKAFVNYFDAPEYYPCVDPPVDCKIGAVDILREMRREKFESEVKVEKVNYDLESLIGSKTKRARIQSKYISDDSSD